MSNRDKEQLQELSERLVERKLKDVYIDDQGLLCIVYTKGFIGGGICITAPKEVKKYSVGKKGRFVEETTSD